MMKIRAMPRRLKNRNDLKMVILGMRRVASQDRIACHERVSSGSSITRACSGERARAAHRATPPPARTQAHNHLKSITIYDRDAAITARDLNGYATMAITATAVPRVSTAELRIALRSMLTADFQAHE